MTSGSLLVMSAAPRMRGRKGSGVRLQGPGHLLQGLDRALGLGVHLLELLLAQREGDRADDSPENRHDQRRPTVADEVGQRHQRAMLRKMTAMRPARPAAPNMPA